jgi:hypothetical protein
MKLPLAKDSLLLLAAALAIVACSSDAPTADAGPTAPPPDAAPDAGPVCLSKLPEAADGYDPSCPIKAPPQPDSFDEALAIAGLNRCNFGYSKNDYAAFSELQRALAIETADLARFAGAKGF